MSTVVVPTPKKSEDSKEKSEDFQKKYQNLYEAIKTISACPESLQTMKVPRLLTACGHTFDQDSLQNQAHCPSCLLPIPAEKGHITNYLAKNIINVHNSIKVPDETKEKSGDFQTKYQALRDAIKPFITCEVLFEIMSVPVLLTACGHTYEKSIFEKTVKCPMCRTAIPAKKGQIGLYEDPLE